MRTWVFFGDDWGAHPSTAQHLASALPAGDALIWVDSLTMRSIRLSPSEILTVVRRLTTRLLSRRGAVRSTHRVPDVRLSPMIVPLHGRRAVRIFNRTQVGRGVRRALTKLGAYEPLVVVSNPVAVHFLDAISPRAVAYLRLDDYALLPGVDCTVIEETEPAMIARADVVVATALSLLPRGARRTLYLPQGVDVEHFSRVPLEPPRGRVVGFFGMLAEWIDDELVMEVARRLPTWTFEFIGPTRGRPSFLNAAPNIVWRGSIPYEDLPLAATRWNAAWIPFRINELTRRVNPIKLREYLAAGLPTFSTPLPESIALGRAVRVGSGPDDVERFLGQDVAMDNVETRRARRASIAEHSWGARATHLVKSLTDDLIPSSAVVENSIIASE